MSQDTNLSSKDAHKLRDISFIPEPFRSAIRDWIAARAAANISPWTIWLNVEGLYYFFQWLESQNLQPAHLTDITRQMIADYQLYLYRAENKRWKGRKLSVSTQFCRLTAVTRFCDWLTREERIFINPAAKIQLPRRPKRIPRNYLTHKEVNRLLRAPDLSSHLGLRNRAILETMYSTGIRASELRYLKISDLNANDGWLSIRVGKGAKDRTVPVGKAALHFVALYLEKTRPRFAGTKNDWLFVTQWGERLAPDTLGQIIRNAAKKAKIKRAVSPHSLRHTCATLMLRGRAGIRHIQELLGHRSLDTTQIYTKVEITDLKKVHERCHPREKEALDKK
jgi:integrase/recombinase XerD